jgi:hypothetical protein
MKNNAKKELPYYVPKQPPVPSLFVALGDAIGAWGEKKKRIDQATVKKVTT